MSALNGPTRTISPYLRGLGLRQRERPAGSGRDVVVEGRYEGDLCVETYVVPLNKEAVKTIAAAAEKIAAETAGTEFPFEVGKVPGPDGRPVTGLVCRVAVPRNTQKPRSTPKHYTRTPGRPRVNEVTDEKTPRRINVLGPVWEGSIQRAREVHGLSVSQVAEQLLSAFAAGAFQFDQNGELVLSAPTAEQTREILLETLQQHGVGTNDAALAEALAAALHSASHTRAE
ncbi:hypothetical protein ACFV1L_22130 [Kitasatospora sp. NPDC059646]|uniref:hypothetical protein n=1 Tax=Kitasatospora sp. NPDC059646 TaxID=3346893 RepID=UPI0036B80346